MFDVSAARWPVPWIGDVVVDGVEGTIGGGDQPSTLPRKPRT
jgi:hypothetical protein